VETAFSAVFKEVTMEKFVDESYKNWLASSLAGLEFVDYDKEKVD